ncbi:MAG: hypothetical protein H7Z43_15710 [Clostridia bacterium]|nr:hypothetical protein [Deltaproteobacteria bacterium]
MAKATMQLDHDAEALLLALLDNSVELVVIGGLAVVFHGYIRLTDDVDISYARAPANLTAIADALAPFHPRLRGAPAGLPFVLDSRTLKSGLNFTLETDLGAIDLLGEVTGLGQFDDVIKGAIDVPFAGRTLRVIGLAALKRAKRGAGRVKDLLDLEALDKLG